MKRHAPVGIVFALLVLAIGCSSSPTTAPPAPALMKGEAEIKELLKLTTEMQDTVEKDPAKGLEYLGKVAAAAKKLQDLKLTEDEQKKLQEKYKAEFDKLEERQKKAKDKK
jgi:NifU-like protein involved in Fe-S cluster formation